ncbi:Carboxymuconolactone decarboxylase family protein [Crateriforma conspicua]|uniref:Carboxymuconolactone decarboxylase family protein n=1 Tax=Crateriforma conspicua TaxID=2527996 RepID=A0A5C6FPP2_9PLAN|nr:carboxymuconolactone decarboxylase family protein [Crateriforma conspicua]TWU62608.1 Carboxymuconolactone decarboxylase family protein [Crateriforma conspicua]
MEASEFKVVDALDTTGQSSALTDREKHLVGLTVTVTRGCAPCSGGRIEKALSAGIEYETIRAAIDLAAAVNAGVVVRTAIEGAARNNITAACTGDECTVGTPS